MEKTRTLGNTDIQVSAIGYGCMGQTHSYGIVEPEQAMVELMRYAYEIGYTLFDTAPFYGADNERYLGKAITPIRDQVVLATKFGIVDEHFTLDSSRDSILREVDASLSRLGTDRIDLYYQHRIDSKTEPEEVAETMAELIKAGKIRAWGVSFAPIDYIRRAHKVCKLSAVQNVYSPLNTADEATYFPLCAELGLTYVSACPLAKGFLSGRYHADTQYRDGDWRGDMKLFHEEGLTQNRSLLELLADLAEQKNATPAQITLAWELAKNPNLVPIPGTTKPERVRENFGAVEIGLTPAEVAAFDEALSHMDLMNMGRG